MKDGMRLFIALAVSLWSSLAWAQTPGTWHEFANTRFTGSAAICGNPGAPVPPTCLPGSLPGGGNNQASSAIDAWVDGDYVPPPVGLFIVPRGGGHADWAGNQVVGFNPTTGQWSQLSPPSRAYTPMATTGSFPNPYTDGTPPSVHSYGAVAWMPWLSKMWSAGGIYWSPGGESVPATSWWWNPATPGLREAWSQKANRPGGYGAYAVADPTATPPRVLLRTSSGLLAYNPATDTYTTLYAQSILGTSARALDGAGRKLYSVSNQSGGGTSIQRTDLNNLSLREVTLVTTGGPTPPYGPGLRYDAGRLVMFGPGPTTATGAIWTLVPNNCGTTGLPACAWTRLEAPDGVHPPKPHINGTFKRFFAHGCDYYVIINGSTNVWKYRPTWSLEGCGAPPPRTATLTVELDPSSTGSATVEGGGTFPVGTAVTPTVIPAAESALVGWNTTTCGATFTLAADTVCRATVAKNQPSTVSVTSPTLNQVKAAGPATDQPLGTVPIAGLKPRTWTALPAGPVPFLRSKHTRLIHDSKRGRMVLAGGDGTGPEGDSYTGQNVFAIDLAQSGVWTKLHGFCASPGGVQPNRPDNVTWAYDPKRDQGVMMPAYYGGGVTHCPGITDDPLKRGYTFNFATNQWAVGTWPTPVHGYGGDLHNHFGVLDPVTDAVYRFFYTGSINMQIVPLNGAPAELIKLPGLGDMSNDQSTIDAQGRAIYAISRSLKAIVKYSIPDKKVVERIPLPTGWVTPTGEFGGGDFETLLAFDSRNRVLLNPVTVNYGGKALGLGIYHVDTKRWEWDAVPETVSGNTFGYDATNNVFLFLGRNAGKAFWLYRYAD